MMVDARGVWVLCSEGSYCFHAPSGAHAFTQAYSHAHAENSASGLHADGYTQNDDSPDTWVWVAENCHHPDIVRWLTKSQAPVKRQANAEISNDQLPGHRRCFWPFVQGPITDSVLNVCDAWPSRFRWVNTQMVRDTF